MEIIVNANQAKRIDIGIQSTCGVSSMLLMERAAIAIYSFLKERNMLKEHLKFGILCGSGNNGGDGLALARLLKMDREDVIVFLAGDAKSFTDSALRQHTMAKKTGVFFAAFLDELAECDVIIDALFGVGLSRNVEGRFADILDRLNEFSAYKIAVDMPSGIDASTGRILGTALKCDATITFGYKKCGQLLYPGREYCGLLICENIGLNIDLLKGENPEFFESDDGDIKAITEARPEDSHKGTFGKVLVIAGSKGMSGAAFMCAKSAIVSGCGMVMIETDECNRTILASMFPEAILSTYPDKPDFKVLRKHLDWADLVVFGPGVGQSEVAISLLDFLLSECHLPLIIDADGLNLLARDVDRINHYDGDVVLTPHMAEMSRLTGIPMQELRNDRLEIAREFCIEHDVTLVLKDSCTIVASPYKPIWINSSGNSGLSTAGSGDVLCGMIAGLLASVRTLDAVPKAVYLHGKCAQHYCESRNRASMTAGDIIREIPYCY